MAGHEKHPDGKNTEVKHTKEPDDAYDNIVRHELDAAVNSLKKRIENLKGVDVSFPKKPNPFGDDRRKPK